MNTKKYVLLKDTEKKGPFCFTISSTCVNNFKNYFPFLFPATKYYPFLH